MRRVELEHRDSRNGLRYARYGIFHFMKQQVIEDPVDFACIPVRFDDALPNDGKVIEDLRKYD